MRTKDQFREESEEGRKFIKNKKRKETLGILEVIENNQELEKSLYSEFFNSARFYNSFIFF